MRGATGMLAGIILLAACGGGGTTPTEPPAPNQLVSVSASRGSEESEGSEDSRRSNRALERDLATLRRVTAPFHSLKKAEHAGWSTQVTTCMGSTSQGGMGYHYGKPEYINDGTAQVDRPDLLLYEPQKNGTMRLVAVEYVILYTAHPRNAAPPMLMGKQFTKNDTFQLWGLHVWLWRKNPNGLFADWNPEVTCAYAPDGQVMPVP